jgi:hypothetical protein
MMVLQKRCRKTVLASRANPLLETIASQSPFIYNIFLYSLDPCQEPSLCGFTGQRHLVGCADCFWLSPLDRRLVVVEHCTFFAQLSTNLACQ